MAKTDLHARVEHNLTLHPPTNEAVIERMAHVRASAKQFAHDVVDACPEGRELSMALTEIEDACQHAIGAIARNQENL